MNGHLKHSLSLQEIIGKSDSILKVKEKIKSVASTDASVLITGEPGTGKTLIGNIIHNLHPVRKMHLISRINISKALPYPYSINLESQDGSLFFEGIDSASPESQTALFNLLEASKAMAEKNGNLEKMYIRIIASSTRCLNELLNHSFRKELFFKISDCVIELIPLRERKEDIKPLAHHFTRINNDRIRYKPISHKIGRLTGLIPAKLLNIEPGAINLLEEYDWPGNIRELKNVIRAAMVESREDSKATVLKAEWIKFPTYGL
jgi:two-component system response regulator PilR (NtrC family)/two-component system nitrogen regulation response regulator GlnG/two-component system response regulator HydG